MKRGSVIGGSLCPLPCYARTLPHPGDVIIKVAHDATVCWMANWARLDGCLLRGGWRREPAHWGDVAMRLSLFLPSGGGPAPPRRSSFNRRLAPLTCQ